MIRSSAATLFTLLALLLFAAAASGHPSYYDTSCAACHITVAATCNGCHAHGVRAGAGSSGLNLSGSTGKSTYSAGEQVAVTVTGGNQVGWVRAILLDQGMVELDRSSGPDSIGGGAGFPLVLTAPAPKKSGAYRWNVAWYGSRSDAAGAPFGMRWILDPDNPDHGSEVVATNEFTVVAGPQPTIKLTPGVVDFGVAPGGTAVTRTVQVANMGTAELSVSGIAPCPGTGGEFTWNPTSLLVAPGGSEPLQVTYTPSGVPRSRACVRLLTNDPERSEMLLLLRTAPTVFGK